MDFKNWLSMNEIWISKGKAQDSLFKPGPKTFAPKPPKLCGMGGGPGPGGACASGGEGEFRLDNRFQPSKRIGRR